MWIVITKNEEADQCEWQVNGCNAFAILRDNGGIVGRRFPKEEINDLATLITQGVVKALILNQEQRQGSDKFLNVNIVTGVWMHFGNLPLSTLSLEKMAKLWRESCGHLKLGIEDTHLRELSVMPISTNWLPWKKYIKEFQDNPVCLGNLDGLETAWKIANAYFNEGRTLTSIVRVFSPFYVDASHYLSELEEDRSMLQSQRRDLDASWKATWKTWEQDDVRDAKTLAEKGDAGDLQWLKNLTEFRGAILAINNNLNPESLKNFTSAFRKLANLAASNGENASDKESIPQAAEE